jgi:hypothetical protein
MGVVALREMRKGGFSQHFWLYPCLARVIKGMDVEKLRRKARIPAAATVEKQ